VQDTTGEAFLVQFDKVGRESLLDKLSELCFRKLLIHYYNYKREEASQRKKLAKININTNTINKRAL